ncbi:MAG: LysR family transcriptional regulator [Verrucomicrobiota bacterium]
MELDFDILLVFRTLAETRSFTETGKIRGLSQPAISQLVADLEARTGLVLFERSDAGATLTPDGKEFLASASAVCEAYQDFLDSIAAMGRRGNRKVCIGVDKSWFSNRMRNDFGVRMDAAVEFSDLSADWPARLLSGKYDVAIAARFMTWEFPAGIEEAVVLVEKGISVAWNPVFYPFSEHDFQFPDILGISLLVPNCNVSRGFASAVRLWCKHAYGPQPLNVIEFGDEGAAAAAAAAGLGVLLAPGNVSRRLGDCTNLRHVKTFEFLLPEGFALCIYCRATEKNREIQAAAAALAKYCRAEFA